jgi:pimeloyl-ACP methyl ester carboxylesterase
MATISVNGVKLFYELDGAGEVPLVLVHGSWSSHEAWEFVVPALRERFRVLTYDRRGHSASERPAGQGSLHEDLADLAALIEALKLGPAYVAGNSFGASLTLRLAAERPDLVRGIAAHEPPLFALLAGKPDLAPVLAEVGRRIAAVVDRIGSGDHPGAAEQFVETLALGPGQWAELSQERRRIFIENAPTFLDETNDPDQLTIDVSTLRAFTKPALLTMGHQSPPPFAPVTGIVAGSLPHAEVLTFSGAGHIPQTTHPELYVEAITAFIEKNEPKD